MHFTFYTFFNVSSHISGLTVCVSHFTCFSVFLAIFHVLLCELLIFLICQFSLHIPGTTIIFPISSFVSLLDIFTFLQLHFLFITFFSFSRHIPGYTVFVSHYQRFSIFSPYSMSYSMHISFFTLFTVSPYFPSPTVFVSHFERFYMFLVIFQALPWFSHFHHLSFLWTYSRS